jgi:hypothetical protein
VEDEAMAGTADQEWKEREYQLQLRAQNSADEELRLKQRDLDVRVQEQARSRWTSPLMVAIMTAALAGIINLVLAALNNHYQNETKREKIEAARVAEMIKTGDIKTAIGNLKFLIETGLIRNPDLKKSIQAYLDTHPDSGPVLPASDRYAIEPTQALPVGSQALIQNALDDYAKDFDKLGFNKPDKRVPIRVENGYMVRSGYLSSYDQRNQEIVIDALIVSKAEVDAPRREYTHFILTINHPNLNFSKISNLYLLESDLADYFVGSYADRPELNRNIEFVRRTLMNKRDFRDAQPPRQAFEEAREVWGAAFWAIRQSLRRASSDAILADAWRKLPDRFDDKDTASMFIDALLRSATTIGTSGAVASIKDILRERHFPVP